MNGCKLAQRTAPAGSVSHQRVQTQPVVIMTTLPPMRTTAQPASDTNLVRTLNQQVRAVEKTCWATTYSGGWGQVKQARSIDRGGTATLAHVAEELPGATGQQLTVGRYQWNVTIQLPTSAPSTFEQDWGDAG